MKKVLCLLAICGLVGCLNTQNRKVEVKSKNTAQVTSTTAPVKTCTQCSAAPRSAPRDQDLEDMEYFEKHSVRWPKDFKPQPQSGTCEPQCEPDYSEPKSTKKLY